MRAMARLFLSLLICILFFPGSAFTQNTKDVRLVNGINLNEIKPGELVYDMHGRRPFSAQPVIEVFDTTGLKSEHCGNGKIEKGEDFFNCPQDCGVPVSEMTEVKGGEILALVVSPVKGASLQPLESSIEIWDCLSERAESLNQTFILPKIIKKDIVIGYTLQTEKIKIKKHGIFGLGIYRKMPTALNREPEKLTTYKNNEYGFQISLVSGWRVKEDKPRDESFDAVPAVVWHASFYHDTYGTGMAGYPALPAIEMSVEEFPSKRELSGAIYLSKVPCGVPANQFREKFKSSEFSYSQPFFLYQGRVGAFLRVVCNKGMEGLVLIKGNRLYKFMFLTNSTGRLVFETKQIESMLNTLKFKDAGKSELDFEQIALRPTVNKMPFRAPSEFELRIKELGRRTARVGKEMIFYHPHIRREIDYALQTAKYRFRRDMEEGILDKVKYSHGSGGLCGDQEGGYMLEEMHSPSNKTVLFSLAQKTIDDSHVSVRFKVYNDENLDALSDRFFAEVQKNLDNPENNIDFMRKIDSSYH